ncbi:hypothetical protein J6590_003475 [Homalodisca vitripennis]|nr:hypothetical protein J6590_003475 [Homalodisca vitripennis]
MKSTTVPKASDSLLEHNNAAVLWVLWNTNRQKLRQSRQSASHRARRRLQPHEQRDAWDHRARVRSVDRLIFALPQSIELTGRLTFHRSPARLHCTGSVAQPSGEAANHYFHLGGRFNKTAQDNQRIFNHKWYGKNDRKNSSAMMGIGEGKVRVSKRARSTGVAERRAADKGVSTSQNNRSYRDQSGKGPVRGTMPKPGERIARKLGRASWCRLIQYNSGLRY